MRSKRVLVFLLFLTAAEALAARADLSLTTTSGGIQQREGTWSARSNTGVTLGGTWTAVADPRTGAVTGTWTLNDASGRTLRRGAWSAAKAPKAWSGAWRATVTGAQGEYAGTWSADVDLKPDAPFAVLFELAVKAAVSGSWRAGGQSGAWSIRTSA